MFRLGGVRGWENKRLHLVNIASQHFRQRPLKHILFRGWTFDRRRRDRRPAAARAQVTIFFKSGLQAQSLAVCMTTVTVGVKNCCGKHIVWTTKNQGAFVALGDAFMMAGFSIFALVLFASCCGTLAFRHSAVGYPRPTSFTASVCKPSSSRALIAQNLGIPGPWNADSGPATKDKRGPFQTCETDHDCNPGGRNWPLVCKNFLVAKFCIDSESTDDWSGGRRMEDLALVPIPVRTTDGFLPRQY